MFLKLFGLGKSNKKVTENNQYNIDIECNYCPKCGDEYRAEIETCATCAIPLQSGSEKLEMLMQLEANSSPRSMEISEEDELVTIHGGKLNSLKSLQHLLKAEYVPSLLFGDIPSKG
jgi:hypothetical protein